MERSQSEEATLSLYNAITMQKRTLPPPTPTSAVASSRRRTWRFATIALVSASLMAWLVMQSIGLSVTLQSVDHVQSQKMESLMELPLQPQLQHLAQQNKGEPEVTNHALLGGLTTTANELLPSTNTGSSKVVLGLSIRTPAVMAAETLPAAKRDKSLPSFPGDYHKKPANSTFSYAFLLLVNPAATVTQNHDNSTERASAAYYRGFLYNVLVAIYTLKESGSTADFVVYIRIMSPKNSPDAGSANNSDSKNNNHWLPWHEMQWLDRLECRIIYLPAAASSDAPEEDFRQSQFYKFHILDLIEYQRVLYLDADIMPLCNLDYIFHLSTTTPSAESSGGGGRGGTGVSNTTIKENLVLAWLKEPANGGFFMLKPGVGELDALQSIIQQQKQQQQQSAQQHQQQREQQQLQQGEEEEVKAEQVGGFDKILGWGHVIQKPDRWMAFQKKYVNKKWNFYAADGDQGLLYHWVKYYKQSVTLVYGVNAEDWGHGNGTTLVRERTHQPFANQSCLELPPEKYKSRYSLHPAYGRAMQDKPPYSDFLHFYGPFKPFENLTLAMMSLQRLPNQTSKYDSKSSLDYFFQQLRKVNDLVNMGLDFEMGDKNMSSHKAALHPKPWIQELQAPPLEQRRVPRKKKHASKQSAGP